jgi:transposase-like protein
MNMEEKKTMTIRDIAETTGKDESTVRKWITSASEENPLVAGIIPVIKRKMSDSSPMYPANFTLLETVAIIRAGGNELLANLLEQNAKLSFDDIEAKDEADDYPRENWIQDGAGAKLIFTGPGGNAVNLKTLSALLEVDERTIRRRADELGIKFIRGKSPVFDRDTSVKIIYMIYQRKPQAECDRILKKVTAYFGTTNVPAVGGMKNVTSNTKDEVIRRMVECLNLLTGGSI